MKEASQPILGAFRTDELNVADADSWTADTEALLGVLDEYPWLAETLINADWWVLEDGDVLFNARIEDGEERRAGIEAFTRALGMDLQEESPSDSAPMDLPSHAPMRLSELLRELRSRGHS